ncbi:MAG: DUF349 domain-containing protein [Paludibacteraceae bacterium]|nr:DUF349 domain-containing protein [Paludibacteraceae bacterium]
MDHEDLNIEQAEGQVQPTPAPEAQTEPEPELNESDEQKVEETAPAEEQTVETVEEVEPAKEQKTEEPDFNSMDEEQLLEQLRDVIEHKSDDMRRYVEIIQGRLWKLINAAQEEAHRAFEAAAQEGEEFKREASATEIKLKELLQKYKSIREEERKKIEQERAENLAHKLQIIDKMKELSETEGDALSKLDTYKELQQEWKKIGPVPAERQNELWTSFNHYQERFYDQVKMSHELRDYDFRKNYELKQELIEAAKKLADNPDIISAARALQQLHDQWKQIGPVAREVREDIWNQFKEVTAIINRKHQAYFDELHKNEEENFRKKEQLCQRVELIDIENVTSVSQWLELTEQVQAIQQEWKTIGYASRKLNDQIFDRFRAACNRFFDAKNAALNEQRKENNERISMKKKLIAQVEGLLNNENWKLATERVIELQNQWKEIGSVGRQRNEELWQKFRAACDKFFEAKKQYFDEQRAHYRERHAEEADNLTIKEGIIERIDALDPAEKDGIKTLRSLIAEYNAAGRVPYNKKDDLYKRFREAVDKQFDAMHVDASQRRLDNYREDLDKIEERGENALADEKRKLTRIYENIKQEIKTAENNIGFFSRSKADQLLKEASRKIDSLQKELKVIEEKLRLIDDKLQ